MKTRDIDEVMLDIEGTKDLLVTVNELVHNPMLRTLGGMPAACKMKRDIEQSLALYETEFREIKNSVRGGANGQG